MGEWDPEDEPEREHRNLFPHCPLMRGDLCGNVTAAEEEENSGWQRPGESLQQAAERRWMSRTMENARVRKRRLSPERFLKRT